MSLYIRDSSLGEVFPLSKAWANSWWKTDTSKEYIQSQMGAKIHCSSYMLFLDVSIFNHELTLFLSLRTRIMSTTCRDSFRDQSFFVVWQCSRNMWLTFLIIFYYQFHSTFGQFQNFRQFDTGMNIINDGIEFVNKMAFSEVFLVFIYWRCFVSQKTSSYF